MRIHWDSDGKAKVDDLTQQDVTQSVVALNNSKMMDGTTYLGHISIQQHILQRHVTVTNITTLQIRQPRDHLREPVTALGFVHRAAAFHYREQLSSVAEW